MARKTRTWMLRTSFVLAIGLAWTGGVATDAQETRERRWYKGNLHTHTVHSDGDSSPEFVARWYKEHDYQFLVLSDHNYFTDPDGLNTVMAASEQFLLIGGEEVTSRFEKKPVHLNAYGIDRLVPPQFGASIAETIQLNVNAIHAADGIAALNHPNFGWAITAEDMKVVDGLEHFEVYNGHPTVHNEGGGDAPSLEQTWDAVLTAGRRIFAVATDDAHVFKAFGPQYSNPGRGWVMVSAPELTTPAIIGAIRQGDFYASTGVELASVERGGKTLRVKIEQDRNFKYTTRFIGPGGKVLSESPDLESEYTLKPGEPYVRATITDSGGRRAWTQPAFN